MMDILFEEIESPLVHYYCVATDYHRYDLSIIYSNHFFGKVMVISIQTQKMVLMCQEDIENESCWVERLGISSIDIGECQIFLRMVLPLKHFSNQY